MNEPTPRQQAGYLRRLLRRGAIEVVDPRSGAPLPAAVELAGDVVQILPALGGPARELDPEGPRWDRVLERLRKVLSLEDAEELASAVEQERSQSL